MKCNSRTLFDYIDGRRTLSGVWFQNLTFAGFERSNQPLLSWTLRNGLQRSYGVFSFDTSGWSCRNWPGIGVWGRVASVLERKVFISIYSRRGRAEVESAILKIGKATANSIPATGQEVKISRGYSGKDFGLVNKSIRYLKSHILLNQRFFIATRIFKLNRETGAVLVHTSR